MDPTIQSPQTSTETSPPQRDSGSVLDSTTNDASASGQPRRTVRMAHPPDSASQSGPLHSTSSGSLRHSRSQTNSSMGTHLVPYMAPGDRKTSAGLMSSWAADLGDENPLQKIFSTRRPRDVGAGLSSGLKSAAKGVGLGVASLLAAPAYGAYEGGVGGFFKGLGTGVFMALVLPVTGVGIGVAQTARGVINTPEAFKERRAGKKWDKKSREWRENWYSLDGEVEQVDAQAEAMEEQKKNIARNEAQGGTENGGSAGKRSSSSPRTRTSETVADMTYYDLLKVKPTASSSEIRKNYYKLARECHPDKNPDDPDARAKFQALGEAYQVLGDDKRRTHYDQYGKDATQDMSIIESGLFFAMLFGAEAFEPYVGRLKMTTLVESIEEDKTPASLADDIMEFEQWKREVKLAVELRDRLQPFVDGDEEQKNAWRKTMRNTAKELCNNTFGNAMVEGIGWVYENYSCQFLGKLDTFLQLGGRYAKFQAKNREMSKFWKISASVVKASLAAKRLSRAEARSKKAQNSSTNDSSQSPPATGAAGDTSSEHAPGTQEEFKRFTSEEIRAKAEEVKQFEETIPLILETMLQICLLDVEATIRKASKKVLKDMATPIQTRRQYATALIELGQIFQQEADQFRKDHKDEKIDVIRQIEDIYIRAAAAEAEKEEESHAGGCGSSSSAS